MGKKHGKIITDLVYNDQAETEILIELFDFHGRRIGLDHMASDVGINMHENPDFEDLSIYIRKDGSLLFGHNYGDFQATPIEIYNALRFINAAREIKRALR